MLNARGTHDLLVLDKLPLRHHGSLIEDSMVGRVQMHHPSLVVMFALCEGGHRGPGEEEGKRGKGKGGIKWGVWSPNAS